MTTRAPVPADNQDKEAYFKIGQQLKEDFVETFGKRLNLKPNPAKKKNVNAPDLIRSDGKKAIVHVQTTPFFMAEKHAGIDPNFAVTFNHKDLIRYKSSYPDIVLYFWVNWNKDALKAWWKYNVQPQNYVAEIDLKNLDRLCQEENLHSYQQRADDTRGNAKTSYVLSTAHSFFKTHYLKKQDRCNTCLHYWFKKLKPYCFKLDNPIKNIRSPACAEYIDRFEKELNTEA